MPAAAVTFVNSIGTGCELCAYKRAIHLGSLKINVSKNARKKGQRWYASLAEFASALFTTSVFFMPSTHSEARDPKLK